MGALQEALRVSSERWAEASKPVIVYWDIRMPMHATYLDRMRQQRNRVRPAGFDLLGRSTNRPSWISGPIVEGCEHEFGGLVRGCFCHHRSRESCHAQTVQHDRGVVQVAQDRHAESIDKAVASKQRSIYAYDLPGRGLEA